MSLRAGSTSSNDQNNSVFLFTRTRSSIIYLESHSDKPIQEFLWKKGNMKMKNQSFEELTQEALAQEFSG